MANENITSFSSGGGCGCKISQAELKLLLNNTNVAQHDPQLIIGNKTGDDCAVWQVNEETMLVSSTDFFSPIVDDPFSFGKIAATNALSDIFAMGAEPIFALAVVGMPFDKIGNDVVQKILEGGASACTDAGTSIAGGHTINCAEPIYGLAVNGICKPSELLRNDTAKDGDNLILTKPLGVGILSAAFKQKKLDEKAMEDLIKTTTTLNLVGREIAKQQIANAMTDVTGFGLLGHLAEICNGSGLSANVDWQKLPLLASSVRLARAGVVTGASARNLKSCENMYSADTLEPWQINLLSDPQTSGGLLICCSQDNTDKVLDILQGKCQVIGSLEPRDQNKKIITLF